MAFKIFKDIFGFELDNRACEISPISTGGFHSLFDKDSTIKNEQGLYMYKLDIESTIVQLRQISYKLVFIEQLDEFIKYIKDINEFFLELNHNYTDSFNDIIETCDLLKRNVSENVMIIKGKKKKEYLIYTRKSNWQTCCCEKGIALKDYNYIFGTNYYNETISREKAKAVNGIACELYKDGKISFTSLKNHLDRME